MLMDCRRMGMTRYYDHGQRLWWLCRLKVSELSVDRMRGTGFEAVDHGYEKYCNSRWPPWLGRRMKGRCSAWSKVVLMFSSLLSLSVKSEENSEEH